MATIGFDKLNVDALENVSGGAAEFDENLADLYVDVAKDEGMTFDEMLASLKHAEVDKTFARRGKSYNEFVGLLRTKW